MTESKGEDIWTEEVGKRIFKAFSARGGQLAGFCSDAGISRERMQRIFRGTADIRLTDIKSISSALQLSDSETKYIFFPELFTNRKIISIFKNKKP